MSTTTEPTTVRFGRRSSRGLLLGFSTSRVVVVGVASAVAIAGLVAGQGRGFVLTAVVWLPLLAAAFVRVGGRPAVEWAPTAVQYWGRRQTGQTDYRAAITRPRPAGSLALGGDGAALRFYIDEASGAAMIHDPHRRTLTAVLAVSHPAFVLLDRDDRALRVSRWGRVLAGLAQSGTLAALQVTEATVPDPGDGLVEWFAAPRQRIAAGWAAEQYAALLEQARLGSSTHRTTVSIALDLRAAARVVKAAGGGLGGAVAVLRQDMTGPGRCLAPVWPDGGGLARGERAGGGDPRRLRARRFHRRHRKRRGTVWVVLARWR